MPPEFTFGSNVLPKLVVFDLDLTLWDCGGSWCDCLTPPFSGSGDSVYDQLGAHVRLYDDVASILNACDDMGVPMSLASRTEQPAWACELLDRLEIRNRFAFEEIYPACKLKHFAALHEASGISFEDMLFFDDERRNIVDVSTLGVTCVYVNDGITLALFEAGLLQFQS